MFDEMDANIVWPKDQFLDEIDMGGFDETCSIDDFMTYYTSKSNVEVSNPNWVDGSCLTVFWHLKGVDAFDYLNYMSLILGGTEPEPEVPQEKIKSILESVRFWSDSILLQFWAPTQIRGQNHKVLTPLGQPFGFGRPLYKGLCRYRKRCLDHAYSAYGSGEDSQLGPPERVFKQGYPEFCPNIEAYSTQEFPLRDYAVHECGIEGYWALPIFQLRQLQQQRCLGVLEFVAMRSTYVENQINTVFRALKEENLKCPSSYFHKCNEIRKSILSPRVDLKQVLDLVREFYHLPLIQAWLPCMCDDPDTHVGYAGNSCRYPDACETTELFCDMRSCDRNIKYVSDIVDFKHKYGTFSVQEKCLIGKAYALNKPCFSTDTRHFSISDYPFVHLTRRAGLTACFAIPLQFVHPLLDALFLEIFLPAELINYNYDANVVNMLKSLLSTLALGFSRLNVSLGLKQGEEFSVEVSHFDGEFLYFDTCRSAGNLNRHDEALENTGREELQLQSSHPPAMVEMNVTNDKTNAVVTKKHSSVGHSHIQDRVEPSRRAYTNAEVQITLDVLELHFGRNLVDAAESLGVSRSTLKRICRGFGLNRWPSHKRKKVDHHIHTSPRLPTGSILDVGGEVIEESAEAHDIINALEKEAAAPMPRIVNGNSTALRDEIDNKETMIVKATYSENIVKFPLPCKSGIEYLSHEIAKRFKLEVGSFTIKYEDDDCDWIMIPCDEDLRYRMETLKSLGQSIIKLSVFPLTP